MFLITGGSGFFGQQLAAALLKLGHRVRVLDLQPIMDIGLRDKVEFVQGDILDAQVVARAMQGVDTLYHNAAVLPVAKAGAQYHEVNVVGTERILKAAQGAHVRRVVYVSSSAPYGIPTQLPLLETSPFRPFETYGASKREAEVVCERFRSEGLNLSIVRPRTVSGPGRLGIFSLFFDWVHAGKNVYILGSGTNLFQFLDSRDFVDACILLARAGDNEDFNIGAKQFGTLREGLEGVIAHAKATSKVVSLPSLPGRLLLRGLDRLGLSPLGPWHYETLDKPFYFDISKAESMLGWSPKFSNTQSLADSYDWFVANKGTFEGEYGVTHNKVLKQRILHYLRKIS